MKNQVIWGERSYFPYWYGFCPNAKAWQVEMKRLAVEGDNPYPTVDGGCSYFRGPDGHELALVTISDKPNIPAITRIGLIVHEGTHVWQRMCKAMGEDKPSREFEAYSLQSIVSSLIHAYEVTRGPLTHKGKIVI